jgi:histidine triad (HIT) family protein
MPKRKKMNKIKETRPATAKFAEEVKKLSEGLYYISETDAEVLPFAGEPAKAVSAEEIIRQTKAGTDAPVEERVFGEIFARLTAVQEWYGDEEKETAAKFGRLQSFLEQNLKDLKVFKVGAIQVKVYFVGLDRTGRLMGIQTEAVET